MESIIIYFVRTILAIVAAVGAAVAAEPGDGFLGRWGLTVTAGSTEYPSWLEVSRVEGKLAARMVGRSGSVHPVEAKLAGEELEVESYQLRVVGGKIEGTGKDRQGNPVRVVGDEILVGFPAE